MYYQEFHACFDWFHHGEAWSVILLQGLSDPYGERLIHRIRRWSSWYMGDDPHVPNYDNLGAAGLGLAAYALTTDRRTCRCRTT